MKSKVVFSSLLFLVNSAMYAQEPIPAESTQVTPATTTAVSAQPTPNVQVVESAQTTTIDCNYHIAPGAPFTDQAVVSKWADYAIAQSFDYDYENIDKKLEALKTCFTDLGWKSFNDALHKSGNIEAIKSQKLMVSSLIEGAKTITPIKENQWKINATLRVVYQNDKEKLVQPLVVDLIVGRKISGDLGIMQIIAAPKSVLSDATPADEPTT